MRRLPVCVAAVLTLTLASVHVRVRATSSARDTVCDAHANFGCSRWTGGDRLRCAEPEAERGFMPWTARPVPSGMYSVRSGDGPDASLDPKSYRPGEYSSVFVRTLDYGFKYRGLLLHAVDQSNSTVGRWSMLPGLDQLFWLPPQCKGAAVMHNSAALKPFVSHFRFLAPEDASGPITFRALIKRGPPNKGFFYFPNGDRGGDLVLQQAPPRSTSSSEAQWITARAAGQSCDRACYDAGLGSCMQSEMRRVDTAAKLEAAVGHQAACKLPIISDCSSVSPTTDATGGNCWYNAGSTCASWRNGGSPAEVSCSSTGGSAKRFCACRTNKRRLSSSSSSSSTTMRRANLSFHLLLLWLLFPMKQGNKSFSFCGVLLLFLYLAAPCRSHNWLHTPGRARKEASAIKPCRGRKATDTHAQLGPGQSFTMKWATGHTRTSYVVIIRGTDEHFLRDSRFLKYVEDYIANAPTSAHFSGTPSSSRYHGVREGRDLSFYESGGEGLYKRKVPASDPYFFDHKFEKTAHLFEYSPTAVAGDKRVSYKSSDYPWLLSASTFLHLRHLPADYDAIRVSIPSFADPGHYIVHWRWSGFTDCIDVNYHATPQTDIDGVDNGGFVYNRINHAAYQGFVRVVTPCRLATDDARQCHTDLTAYGRTGSRVHDRLGINVVPLDQPPATSAALPSLVENIPWRNQTCATADWSEITTDPSADSTSSLDWAAWATDPAQLRREGGKRCTYVAPMYAGVTLPSIVQTCSTTEGCRGVAWKHDGVDSGLLNAGSKHTFFLCKDEESEADSSYDTLWKGSAVAANDYPVLSDTPVHVATISFQPGSFGSRSPPDLPAGTVPDSGQLFGPHMHEGSTTLSYGWNCAPAKNAFQVQWPKEEPKIATATNTYVQSLGTSCADGTRRTWEMAVPPGVYRVTTQHDLQRATKNNMRLHGCNVENVRLTKNRQDKDPSDGQGVGALLALVAFVEVTDGRITLRGPSDDANTSPDQCRVINTMKIERVAEARPAVWYPAARDVWWQRDLGIQGSRGVGLVSIGEKKAFGCWSAWLFKGNRCARNAPGSGPNSEAVREYGFYHDPLEELPATGAPLRFVNGVNEGAVVGLSDTPCASGRVCGPPTHICSTITRVFNCRDRPQSRCPLQVDCHGKRGRYLFIQLPGEDRIWSEKTTVRVHLARPRPEDAEDVVVKKTNYTPLVCYGVEARIQTDVVPEYVISEDPEDPVFYSTVFVRERAIDFNPLVGAAAAPDPPAPRWRFNGRCLECSKYVDSLNESVFPVAEFSAIRWDVVEPGEQCIDCDREFLGLSLPLHVGGDDEKGANGGASIVWVVATASVFVLVAAVFVKRRRVDLPAAGPKTPHKKLEETGGGAVTNVELTVQKDSIDQKDSWVQNPMSSSPCPRVKSTKLTGNNVGPWVEYLTEEPDENGERWLYYYNEETGETAWELPQ